MITMFIPISAGGGSLPLGVLISLIVIFDSMVIPAIVLILKEADGTSDSYMEYSFAFTLFLMFLLLNIGPFVFKF